MLVKRIRHDNIISTALETSFASFSRHFKACPETSAQQMLEYHHLRQPFTELKHTPSLDSCYDIIFLSWLEEVVRLLHYLTRYAHIL